MILARIAVWVCLTLAAATWAAAEDFRVETDVLLADNKEPVAQYLTLFKGGVVYDFMLTEPKEITIYDVQRGRFILLSPARDIQTTVTMEELIRLTHDIKAQALQSDDPNVRFLAEPKFEVRFDPQERRVELTSQRLIYAAKGIKPPDAGVARRYNDFADAYARLNGVRLGNMPPFARMQLNGQLAEHGLIPEEVVKTVPGRGVLAKSVEVRSRHLFSPKVLSTDEKKIDEAHRDMTALPLVPVAQYLKWPARAAAAQNPQAKR